MKEKRRRVPSRWRCC